MEAMIGLFILSAAMTLIAQLAVTTNLQARQQTNRSIAVQEAANLMDQILATPWDRLSQDSIAQQQLSSTAKEQLRNAELLVTTAEQEGMPASRRIMVEIRWAGPTSTTPQHVRLVSWAFAPNGGPS